MTASTTMIGSRTTFGVEFAQSRSPNYLHVRLWISENWVGDIQDSVMPENMCAKLLRLGCPSKYPELAYRSEADCPPYEDLVERGGGSFGESFDPFALRYYSVVSDRRIHLLWKLQEAYYPLFPDYPRHQYHYSVALADYRTALKAFIASMIDERHYIPRSDLPKLRDIEIDIG